MIVSAAGIQHCFIAIFLQPLFPDHRAIGVDRRISSVSEMSRVELLSSNIIWKVGKAQAWQEYPVRKFSIDTRRSYYLNEGKIRVREDV